MELIEYIRIFRRWFWLIFLAAFVAGAMGFISRSSQQPIYEARTKIIIGSVLQNPDPDSTDIRAPVDLTATYSEIIKTNDVLQSTVDELNLPISVATLRSNISTRTVADTSLLEVIVTYPDPILAADIANALAKQLILKSPSNLTPEQEAQVAIANNQIATLTRQLDAMQVQLQVIDTALADAPGDEDRIRLEGQRTTLIDQINQATGNIALFADTIAQYQQRTGALNVVETASIPTSPIGSSSFSAMLLSAIVGAALAVGGVLLLEYLNDTLRTTDDVARVLSLPILGVISRFGQANAKYPARLINDKNLAFSQASEEYRNLRTNVMFTEASRKPRVIVVTSPGPQDGKSVTAANLAVSMATAGLRVLLVDADLRRPKVHTVFELKNDVGLTTLLPTTPTEIADPNDASNNAWKQCLQDPRIPNLRVISSGFTPNNPAELLGSTAIKRWVDVFGHDLGVDVIIFDTPPCLVVADSVVLAATINAQVLLVVRANSTRSNTAIKAKERFGSVGVTLTGVVLNGANPQEEEYYGYGYYGYYYSSAEESSNGQDTKPTKQRQHDQV